MDQIEEGDWMTDRQRYRKRIRRKPRFGVLIMVVAVLCAAFFFLGRCSVGHAEYDDSAENTDSQQDEEDYDVASDTSGDDAQIEASSLMQDSVSVQNHDVIQTMIDSIADKYNAVGIQVAVVENGVVTDSYASGWATVEEDLMTVEHKIRIASISKVFIGMTAMLLQEDQVVDLDADFGTYWNTTARNPIYPDVPITIRDILHHTSTIITYGDDYSTEYNAVLERLADGYYDSVPGDIDGRYYNNYAFRVLGMTLELAADRSIDDILYDELFCDMEIDASFASGDLRNTNMLATLYYKDGSVARSFEEQVALHMPDTPGADGKSFAGGLTISAVDLAKLTALLANDGIYNGKRYLQEDSVEQMEAYIPQQIYENGYQATPLFYEVGMYGREGIYYHDGYAYGVTSCMSYDPLTGDGVVVLATGADLESEVSGIALVCSEVNQYLYTLLDDA